MIMLVPSILYCSDFFRGSDPDKEIFHCFDHFQSLFGIQWQGVLL
jgi:hypothetical protein